MSKPDIFAFLGKGTTVFIPPLLRAARTLWSRTLHEQEVHESPIPSRLSDRATLHGHRLSEPVRLKLLFILGRLAEPVPTGCPPSGAPAKLGNIAHVTPEWRRQAVCGGIGSPL